MTNCGDTALNGTYSLTSLTAPEQLAWLNYGIAADSPSYVKGTNWIVVNYAGDESALIAYNGGNGEITKLYRKTGGNLNGSTNDWTSYADTHSPPATLCNQVPWSQSFALAAGTGTNIAIPSAALLGNAKQDYVDYNVVATNGINVVASQPVSVYGLYYLQYATTAFTGYPTTLLGTNYCVMARAANNDNSVSEFAIVATASNTTVEIIPSPTADLTEYPPYSTDPIWVTNLQPGETYQLRGEYGNDDVTGTRITSDRPIAVFAGADLANVPDDNTESANPLMQEQMPVESWGKEVLAMSLAGRTNGDTYRILAAYSNTVVTITGKVVTVVDYGPSWAVTTSNQVVVVTNQAGEFYDIIVDGPVEFQASQPIQVAQFANGCNSDYFKPDPNNFPEGDPCEILLPPIAHCLETNIFITLTNDAITGDFDANYVNVIVIQSAIKNAFLDGFHIAATNFVSIGTSGYYGAQIKITNSGPHTVSSSQPICVEVYGFGPADAYGYSGGVVK